MRIIDNISRYLHNKLARCLPAYFSNLHLKELVLGSTVALLFKITGAVCGFLFLILISRFYGTSGTGVYSISFNVLWFASLLGSLGMDTKIVRYASRFAQEQNLQNVSQFYNIAIRMVIPMSILLSVALVAISDHLAVSLFHDRSLGTSFKIMGIALPFYVINSLNVELMRGLKRISVSEYYRNVNVFAISIILLLLLSLSFNYIYIPVISISVALSVGALMSYRHIRRTFNNNHETSTGKPLCKRDILKTSLSMMVSALSAMLIGNVSTIMLGMHSTTDSAGIYSVAYKISILTTPILVVVSVIAAPKFSELYWSGNRADLKNVVSLSSKIIFFLSFPILLATLIFPETLLGLFGNSFITGKHALILLTVGQFVNVSTGLVGFFLNMAGGHVAFRNITVIATFFCIALNNVLIRRYNIEGAAMATMISISLWNIATALYIKVKFNINPIYLPFRPGRRH